MDFIEKHLLKKETLQFRSSEKISFFGPTIPQKEFNIMIRPTDFCNFSCDYCFSYTKNKDNVLSRENIEFLLNKIKDLPITKTYYIHGGEPFAYKDLYYLLDRITQDNSPVLIQTNLKLVNEVDIGKLTKYQNLKLSVSIHQNVDRTEYFNKLMQLNKLNLIDRIEVMYTIHNKKNKSLYKILKNIFNNVDIYYIFNELDQPHLDESEQKPQKSYTLVTDKFPNGKLLTFNEFYTKGINYSFKGLSCTAGNRGFILNYDGNLYRCQSDLFIYKKPFSTIEEYDHQQFKDKEICNRDCCLCDLNYTREEIR